LPSTAAGSAARTAAGGDDGEVSGETTRSASALPSTGEAATTQKAVVQALLQARADAPEAADPSVEARETLDLRMANAAPDAVNTARMNHTIEEVLASGVLGATTAETLCGATLCRIDLTNADSAQLNGSINALSEKLPKLFVRSLVIPTGKGERAVYLATDPEALALAPPSEHHIVVPAPSSAPE
jgi:hypothetical protein